MLYENFGARISSITNTGIVKIFFTDKLIQAKANLTEFNSSYLGVKIQAGEYNDPKNLNFTWKAIDLNTEYLTLELEFNTPAMVSFDVSH
jgi:hypothetical protein